MKRRLLQRRCARPSQSKPLPGHVEPVVWSRNAPQERTAASVLCSPMSAQGSRGVFGTNSQIMEMIRSAGGRGSVGSTWIAWLFCTRPRSITLHALCSRSAATHQISAFSACCTSRQPNGIYTCYTSINRDEIMHSNNDSQHQTLGPNRVTG